MSADKDRTEEVSYCLLALTFHPGYYCQLETPFLSEVLSGGLVGGDSMGVVCGPPTSYNR